MTIIQHPDTYNFSGTIRDIVVDATEKLDFTLSSNGVTIVSETYYPSSDNRITINLRDILEDIIEPVLYEVAETGIPQYTYQIGETIGSFYCIAGGIDAEVSVESYLQGNFLTWQPQTRVTLYHIPHYLRYVSVVESICKVKAFFSDGTSKVAVLKTFSAKSINTVNVTFGTVRGMFESQPTYFDVWVESLEGEMLTWIQRYMLTDFLTGVNDYFIFANSLGGFDTIRFSGDREEINKLDSVNAVFDNETKEYDIDRTRSWKKYTGYITDERIRMWVLDFFNSPCRYHLTDSGLLKRIYISDHKLESTTGDAVGYEFTYVYSVQSRYINIERTSTPPLLEITDPQSEIFFLAPKLNQFELAKIESETDYLFPVQSPMAGKWLAISLKTILDFVSSKGLDVDALQIYLTDHKYATQDWVKEQNYLTSANMDDYVLKKTWDSVFELAEVNGKQVLKIKYDVIGNFGITAYGTGLDSGVSFTGSLVDLVDVAVSGLKAGDILKYDGTHFVNAPIASIAGASFWEQISGKPEYFPTRWSYIKDAPESLPASDVYPWAKASTKPSYTWDDITGKPSVFTPDSHTHVWANITDRPTKLSQFQDDVVVGNYVPQTTWDSVFELAEVNGQRVLKIKYDVVGNWGITAYGTGPDSGGSFTGSLVDLVDVAVSGLKAGDILKYDGTHFVNVPIASIGGASSWEQISGKPDYFPTLWSEIKDAPESLPASDVYPWAKAATKPSYTWDEITGKPTAFTPASHTHLWANITDRPTKLSQFQDDVVAGNYFKLSAVRTTDLNDAPINSFFVSSNNPANSPASYTTYAVGLTLALNNDKNFKQQLIYTADNWYYRSQGGGDWYQWHVLWSAANFNPSNKLDKSVWDEAFEIKTVNGIRVISAKLDVLGQKGISAYADSADSGSAGGGLDYELLKNALTGIITPDGYPFTISSKFLGAIDKSYITGKIGDLYADAVHTHKWTDIADRPTSLPANGGNADTVGGKSPSSFATSGRTESLNSDPNTILFDDVPNITQVHVPGIEFSTMLTMVDMEGTHLQLRMRDYAGKFGSWIRGQITNQWYELYHSGNLTKLSQLQDDVVSGNYFKLSANRVTNLNDTPINSFFVSALGPSYSPVSYATYVNGFCFAADNNLSYKRQLVYVDDWYGRTQNVGTWGGWYKFWHSGNLNPVTIDSDQIITGWKRFNPSTKNGVFNTTGIIGNKDTYGTAFSWTVKSSGSFWNVQQESDSIALIGIQGGKAIKLLSNPSQSQVIADFFIGTATRARQDESGNSIADSYLRLTGGTLTGSLTTQNITANGTVTANRFSGPLSAGYTGNGGQQGPGYVGMYNFICLMMNTPVNGDSSFKNWLLCDAYAGSDVGGATAIGVSRQNMKVFAMSSNADRTTWNRTCEIYTTENANRNSVDWTARNITAAGSITAPTFVGKLSGASTLLNINNDAGQSSVLQFMQMSTQNEANDLPSNTWHHVLKMNHGNGDTYFSRSLAFSFFDNGIYTRYRSNGTAHEWVALYGGHNANRSDVDWTARNINASETGTFKRLVINGIVIEVVNGNLRINGNLVATGGVTSQATA